MDVLHVPSYSYSKQERWKNVQLIASGVMNILILWQTLLIQLWSCGLFHQFCLEKRGDTTAGIGTRKRAAEE